MKPALLLALALSVSSAVASAALAAQEDPAQDSTVPQRADRWVLRLADGSVRRAPARATADGWEVRKAAEWFAIPAREVVSAKPERALLAELDERRTALALQRTEGLAENPAAAAEIATWALGEGLLAEAVSEVGRALANDPDQPQARAWIASAPIALTLPAAANRSLRERLVLFGASAQPAYRELAAVKLAAEPRAETLADLGRALRSPTPSVRAFAAFALRRLAPKAEQDALVRRSVVDPSAKVRTQAALCLRDAKDETLAARVAVALEHPDARLRAAAATTLADMGYRSSLSAVATALATLQASGGHPGGTRGHIHVGNQVAYVQDFNVEIAQAASIADPIVGVVEDATQLDVRVGGVSSVRVEVERNAYCAAMARLSGQKHGNDARKWLAWWERERAAGEQPVTK